MGDTLRKKRVEFYLSFVNKTEIKKESADKLEKLKGVFGDLNAEWLFVFQ